MKKILRTDKIFGCLMHKPDIKQGYQHIDIKLEHKKYLGVALKLDGKLRLFAVLPFG